MSSILLRSRSFSGCPLSNFSAALSKTPSVLLPPPSPETTTKRTRRPTRTASPYTHIWNIVMSLSSFIFICFFGGRGGSRTLIYPVMHLSLRRRGQYSPVVLTNFLVAESMLSLRLFKPSLIDLAYWVIQ